MTARELIIELLDYWDLETPVLYIDISGKYDITEVSNWEGDYIFLYGKANTDKM